MVNWNVKDINNMIDYLIEKNKIIYNEEYMEYDDDIYINNELKVLIKSSKSI